MELDVYRKVLKNAKCFFCRLIETKDFKYFCIEMLMHPAIKKNDVCCTVFCKINPTAGESPQASAASTRTCTEERGCFCHEAGGCFSKNE